MWDGRAWRWSVIALAVLGLGGTAGLAGKASATPLSASWFELAAPAPLLRDFTAGTIRGPAGWEAWCRDAAAKCQRTNAAVIGLDEATATVLARVFATVLARITPVEEPPGQDQWRQIDQPGVGDCDDYAITWREALVAAGLPRGALDVAVAETEQGEIHAVLAVHTNQGTLVFDNRYPTPRAWTSLPYAWLAIEPVTTELAAWQALPDHQRIGNTPPLTAEGEAPRP